MLEKRCALLSSLLLIAGCAPEVEVTFHKPVTDRKQAEAEIYSAIEYPKKPAALSYDWSKDPYHNDTVTISLSEADEQSNEALDNIASTLKNRLVYTKSDVSLNITIQEDNQDVLDTLSLSKGQAFNIPLDWDNAQVGVYYHQLGPTQGNSQTSVYYCGVKIRPYKKAPVLSYSYNVPDHLKGFQLLTQMMQPEAKAEKKLVGITLADDYKIKIEPAQGSAKNGLIYLTFNAEVDTRYQSDFGYPLQGSGASISLTESSCYQDLLKLSNGELGGLKREFSASNNVSGSRVTSYN